MSPSTIAAFRNPTSIAVDPSGRYVYVTSSFDNYVRQYTIGAGGTLTPATAETVDAGSGPAGIAVVGSWQ
jgi:DNA-binding beta-propeller fold protein YncE